jgi:PD-(D/E)XK nuclease superfamily
MKLKLPKPEKVSHSRIRCWRRCKMLHHYRYVQKLKKKKKSLPLRVGSIIHLMIEYYQETGDWQEVWEGFRTEFNREYREEKLEFGDVPALVNNIVKGYVDYYSEDGLTYPKRRGRSTEIRVLKYLSNEVIFDGYIDAYPVDEQGRNWLMDHKSCRFIPSEEQRFSDLQLLIYCWLLPQCGYPKPDGVIWDYLRTKSPVIPDVLKDGSISKNSRIDTTFSVYKATVINHLGYNKWKSDYMDFAKANFNNSEEKFYRRIRLPTPSAEMVNNVVLDLIDTSHEIYYYGKDLKTRNMNKDCSWCEFYNLCSIEVRGLDSSYLKKTEFTCGIEDEEESNEYLEI